MGQRDDRYKVDGMLELDDAFFTVTFPKDYKKIEDTNSDNKDGDKMNKIGRGTDKANVMVMISYDNNISKCKQHEL